MFLKEGLGSSGDYTELLGGFGCRGCYSYSCRGSHCNGEIFYVIWTLTFCGSDCDTFGSYGQRCIKTPFTVKNVCVESN